MISIRKANIHDVPLLAAIGGASFIESHGSSASREVMDIYVKAKYNTDACKEELCDLNNMYHFIYKDQKPAGYSKIILNSPHSNIHIKNITKLDRLYLLKEYYHLKVGLDLFNFNLELSKSNNQAGMWLYVWKENSRAIHFYEKAGFKVIGSYDFKLTETHSNPNNHMMLTY